MTPDRPILYVTRPTLYVTKTHPETPDPTYAYYGDSGLDLFSRVDVIAWPFRTVRIPVGLSCQIPACHEIQLRPRSSWSKVSWLQNIGTIDNRYVNELIVQIYNGSFLPRRIRKGMKVAQAVVAPVAYCRVITTDGREIRQPEATDAVRGLKGFGSSGT